MKHTHAFLIILMIELLMMSIPCRPDKPQKSTINPDVAQTDSDTAEKAAFQQAMDTFLPAMDAQDAGQAVDFSALREAMSKFWEKFPNVHKSVTLLTFYMEMFAKANPERVQDEWALFSECHSPVAAALARGKVRFAELTRQPFELAFTALDGRTVDLGNLRGNVILIDFWATWCLPCIKQITALQRLYAEYHGQGFEIIGVSMDREEDKNKVIDFLSREGLPWPQYYDGKGWQSEIAVRFAINSLPTTFLLDKEGRLVSINPEEHDLESEVKQLFEQHSTSH
jgi:thiol-disulfide isomerase/thioredoxin